MKRRLAEISLHADALRNNLAIARRAAPGARMMSCIKAAGYGHGLGFVANALADASDAFAVACTGEGVALRRAGMERHPICILNGPADHDEVDAAFHWGLDLVVHQPWQVEALAARGGPAQIGAWLKINTGMGRVGVPPAEAREWHARLAACPAVRHPVGMMTHMACADDRSDDYTARQWRTFREATEGLDGPRSAANSASVLGWPDTHAEWARPGIMLYGCSPFIEGADEPLGLQPAMTLQAPLIAINHLEAGDCVGYGRTWSAPQDMPVGVVGIGYGDGYPRHIGAGTPVVVRGCRTTIVGRVSMDKITIDLRGLDGVGVGDPVTLWGRSLPVEEIADAAGTIGYELLCSVHGRVAERGAE